MDHHSFLKGVRIDSVAISEYHETHYTLTVCMTQLFHKHGFRSVYTLTVHIVFVTKYRRKVINQSVLHRLKEIFEETCAKWSCTLVEFNAESDHAHLLVNFPPQVQLSKLIANLKTRLLAKGKEEMAYSRLESGIL